MTCDDRFHGTFGPFSGSHALVPKDKMYMARLPIALVFSCVALRSAIHHMVCVSSIMFGFPTVQVAYLDDKLIEGQDNAQAFRKTHQCLFVHCRVPE